MNRAVKILNCRPNIHSKNSEKISSEENFQNKVLRPIIKFQNELLINLFLSNCKSNKINFTGFNAQEKKDYIEHTLKRDFRLKASFLGTIIAFFTIEEFQKYNVNKQIFNKRIIQMIIERLINQTS